MAEQRVLYHITFAENRESFVRVYEALGRTPGAGVPVFCNTCAYLTPIELAQVLNVCFDVSVRKSAPYAEHANLKE